MMATAVASRFAVLTIEGEDDHPKKIQQKKKTDNKKPTVGATKPEVNQKKKNKKADNGKQQQQPTNKTKAKSAGKNEGNKNATANKKKSAQESQWDQWKQKDSEFVEGHYEQDLQQAILLSKLDYEEKKDVYERLRKETVEEEKRQNSGNSGKRSKKQHNRAQPMSLEQFNNMVDGEGHGAPGSGSPVAESLPPEPDITFFERIRDDTKKALDREHSEDRRKAREPFVEETLLVAQLQDALEKKQQQIDSLLEEVGRLKEELRNVKTRNKKLCQLLAHGEMKDKAEVLKEVDRLQQMNDELSSEVSNLNAQLEQERSKVRALTSDHKTKFQNKKTNCE